MSDRNPFHDSGKGTATWAMGFETESDPPNDSAVVDTNFFLDILNSDELPSTHPDALPLNPPTTTATPGIPENTEPTQTNTSAIMADDNAESTPAPESIKGEDGAQEPRTKKRRRSRNSPEPDYSQIILELNKKRKRTGQACDRCRVRRYKCDPSRNGCFNCRAASMVCKVTDCVTGETYVRGAAGRMAAEIEGLKARVAGLEKENEELQRNTKPRYNFEPSSSLSAPQFPPTTTMRPQQQQAISWDQRIFNLQLENTKLRQQASVLRDNNQTLRKRVEDQEAMLQLKEDITLYNRKYNWSI